MIRINRARRALHGLAALAFLLASGAAAAQTSYPERNPLGSDITVRYIADKLAEAFGKSVIVENVTGAAGGIAADRTAKATPDGYTIGVLGNFNIVINNSLYAKLSCDPAKDLIPVNQFNGFPNTLVVNNDVPAKSVQELIAQAPTLPPRYMPVEKSRPLVERAGQLRITTDISDLSAGEKAAVGKLLAAGAIFQTLYESQLHPQAEVSLADLKALDARLASPEATRNLLLLYRRVQGPIISLPDGERIAFLPVDAVVPGRNFYPWGIARAEVDAYLAAHPEDAEAIMGMRTVVRRAATENLRADLARLDLYPALDTLHPGLRSSLARRMAADDPTALYAVPYAVAYATEMIAAHALLNEAAEAVQKDDEEFARYLRNRSRDLLSNDYESGDAAWVTSRFKNLNVQIGAYETYDDELFGAKASLGVSVLRVRHAETDALRGALRGLQAMEDSLPYAAHKSVRSDIPIGLYDIIADFGETRGVNTASIVPNEAYITRRYGRTILLRGSIMLSKAIDDNLRPAWEAVAAQPFRADYALRGLLNQTMWHEVGHYLGVDRTKDGRALDVALQENHNLIEELKADLVSMFLAEGLHKRGYHTDEQLRGVYGAGILRALTETKPIREDPYSTMQLMQFNYFMQNGLIMFDNAAGTISIDYARFHQVIAAMLREVLALQYQGDKAATDAFIERHAVWSEDLHGVIGRKMLTAEKYKRWLVDYTALGQ